MVLTINEIIEHLKEMSEEIDPRIHRASITMRVGDVSRLQFAREKIQEAIAKLLEID